MPISDVWVDWDQQIINVPKTATQLVQASPTEIRELDLDLFRLQLKNLEDDEFGMHFIDTHLHVTTFDLGDGTTLARSVKIINGYTITFEDGQYRVNLVGANSNISVVTNVNQVGLNSANSAGLVHIDEILDQSFSGRVTIDTVTGMPGTQYPRGTQADPVDNYADALIIASSRKFTDFIMEGQINFAPTDDITRTHWFGQGHTVSKIVFDGNDATGATFFNLQLEGTINGLGELRNCHLRDIQMLKGSIHKCLLDQGPDFSIGDGETNMLDCWSGVAGTNTPVLDLTACTASSTLAIRGYIGGIRLKNLSANMNITIDMIAGNVILDSTITAGTIVVRGICNFTDNTTGTTTVITDGIIDAPAVNATLLATRANTAAIIGLV